MENVFQIAVLRACLAALAVLLSALAFAGLRKVGRLLLRNLKPVALAAILPLAALLTDFAGEKNTNMPLRVIQPVASQAFSSCGAVTNAGWLAHGAYEDWFRIPATNWWVRTADGWLDGLTVFAFCEFRPDIRTTNAFPRPFPQKLSLAPMANWHMLTNREALATSHESLFWHSVTESNTLVMTWMNGLYARCATNLLSFQAELFNDGSVAYRYDGSPVATNDFVVPLALPFDRDGDGLENSVDPEPDVAGPDAHGTNAEWYNTVCSNVLAAVATSCHPPVELTWLGGVNSNAYYFVDVVAERGLAPIYFTGDRTSRLGDPVVVARAGETNRVPLLSGVDYAVTSDTPFSVSFSVDDMYPVVETNEPCVARIRWPLEFTIMPDGRGYRASAIPYDPGCEFQWAEPTRSASCGYSTSGGWIGFSCGGSGDCGCHGCSVGGCATLECASFDLPSVWCGCWHYDPESPGTSTNSPSGPPGLPAISISLDNNVVLYEAAYTNAPGVSVARRSTQVELTLEYDNPTESSLPVTLSVQSGQDRIQLRDPSSGTTVSDWEYTCPPMTSGSRSFLIEGVRRSGGQDDVELRGTIGTGNDTAHLTVVEFVLTPEVGTGSDLLHRHQFGACEQVWCEAYPTGMGVTWQNYGNGSMEPAGDHYKHRVPFAAQNYVLTAEIRGATFPLTVQSLFPTDIIAIDKADYPVVVITNSIPAGEAGCVGMSLPLYCSPTNVSFINIELREFETPASMFTQYFATTNWIGLRDHQGSAISSDWFKPDSKGYFADDVAYIGYCAQPWLGGGTVEWSIPNACRPENLPVADTNMFLTTEQEFSLTADGTARVMKFGYVVERMTNEMINLWRPYGD